MTDKDDPLMMGFVAPAIVEEEVEKSKKKKSNPVAQQNAETAAKREERLQSGGKSRAAPSTPAPPEPVQEDEPKVKSLLLDKVGLFREKFPHLRSCNKLSAKSTIDEIEKQSQTILFAIEKGWPR